jgi:hypothetical protein
VRVHHHDYLPPSLVRSSLTVVERDIFSLDLVPKPMKDVEGYRSYSSTPLRPERVLRFLDPRSVDVSSFGGGY